MRRLVYVPNRQVDVARDLEIDGASYRGVKFFDGPESQVTSVVVLDICPNAKEIAAAYEAAGIPVETIEVGAALYTKQQAPALAAVPDSPKATPRAKRAPAKKAPAKKAATRKRPAKRAKR